MLKNIFTSIPTVFTLKKSVNTNRIYINTNSIHVNANSICINASNIFLNANSIQTKKLAIPKAFSSMPTISKLKRQNVIHLHAKHANTTSIHYGKLQPTSVKVPNGRRQSNIFCIVLKSNQQVLQPNGDLPNG